MQCAVCKADVRDFHLKIFNTKTPPNPAGGEVSQLLPTVECSECSEPVPIHELGEHVCAAKTGFNNPPGIIPPPSPIRGEIKHEATNRIPESRPLSRQEYPPQNEETITDAGGPTSESVASELQTWDWLFREPIVEDDGPVESWDDFLVDPTVSPPFPHPWYVDNTPTRPSRVFPSLRPTVGSQYYSTKTTTWRNPRGRL